MESDMGHLVLVHPRDGQDPTRTRVRPSAALFPTAEESRHIKAALRGLHALHGTWERVAAAMGVTKKAVEATVAPRGRGSYALAVLAAKVAKKPVEHILSGTMTDAARCPSCGGAR